MQMNQWMHGLDNKPCWELVIIAYCNYNERFGFNLLFMLIRPAVDNARGPSYCNSSYKFNVNSVKVSIVLHSSDLKASMLARNCVHGNVGFAARTEVCLAICVC